MASSNDRPVTYSRRFFWFALAIAAAIGLYTAGWHYAAGMLEERVGAAVAEANRDGRRANCETPVARGYPFRLGIFCQSVMFEDAQAGVRFRARELRSAAQIYQPNFIVGELDGPATLETRNLNSLDIDWESMRASVRLASPQPERISVEGEQVSVRLDEAGATSPLLAHAGHAELHTRPTGEGFDLALRFSDLHLGESLVGTGVMPLLAGLADMQVTDWAPGWRGASVRVRNLTLSIGEGDGGVSVTGPVEVGEDGLIDAELRVTLRNPQALAKVLGDLFPQQRREIEMSLSGLALMGDAPSMPLRIVDGEASLGFLTLGTIPPL